MSAKRFRPVMSTCSARFAGPDQIQPLRRGKNGGQATKGIPTSRSILNWLRHPFPHSPFVLLEEHRVQLAEPVGAVDEDGEDSSRSAVESESRRARCS